jgi:hypothetical protein
MSTNNEEEKHEEMAEDGENASPGSRAHESGSARAGNGVSVSKSIRADGAEQTDVVHPPRYMRKTGELRQALEAGAINLDEFQQGCVDGMNAMKAIPCKNGTIVYEPDWPMRLAFRKFITETVEGMPVKRQEIVSRKVTTEEDLIKQAKKSPALARAILKVILKILDPEVIQEVMAEHSKNGGAK